MSLSRSQLAAYARAAGFTGRDVDIAVAVALAESGGDPTAHNYDLATGDDSYGAMQINMLGSLGPDRRKRFNLRSNTDLYDPSTNFRVAYGIYKSDGWAAWSTYKNGKYKDHMTTSPSETSAGNGGSLDPTSILSASINAFGETFMKGFASVGAVIVAVVLLVLGVVILLRSQVTTVIPGGKVAKVAKVAKGLSQ